jgi:hypothetical protein
MDATYFPRSAFLPAKSFGQKLAALFNARAYDQSDLRSVRTSVYYSDFELVDAKMRYVVSIGHALRQSDGRFIVYTSQSEITEDPIRGSISINAGYKKDERDTAIICDEGDVVWRMKELARALNQNSNYSLAFPKNTPLRLCDDLHINMAELIANTPRTHDDIVRSQKRTALHDRCQFGG